MPKYDQMSSSPPFDSSRLFGAVGGHTNHIFYGEPTPGGRKTLVKRTTGWEVMWYLAFFFSSSDDDNNDSRHAWCDESGWRFIMACRPLTSFVPVGVSFRLPDDAFLQGDDFAALCPYSGSLLYFRDHQHRSACQTVFEALWKAKDGLERLHDVFDSPCWVLCMEDATDGLHQPRVMDVKLGLLGYSPHTDRLKKQRIESKLTSLIQKTGVRVCGSMRNVELPDGQTEEEMIRKPLYYALREVEELELCFTHFFFGVGPLGELKDGCAHINHVQYKCGCQRAASHGVSAAALSTSQLLSFFSKQAEGIYLLEQMAFVSTSCLLIYECEGFGSSSSSNASVLLIDFARCSLRSLNYPEETTGFLFGLQSFNQLLSSLRRKLPDEGEQSLREQPLYPSTAS